MHTNVQNPVLTMAELRQLALDCGADDAGGVSLDQPELAEVRQEAAACFPAARCALSLVGRMNREPIRSPARSLANAEFHDASEHLQGAARAVVAALERRGIRALCAPVGFPMESERWGEKM